MTWEIRTGDVLEQLALLGDESVQCVVTSPPYWGLRDYGIEPTVWGGREGCEHEWGEEGSRRVGASNYNQGLREHGTSEGCAAEIARPLDVKTGSFCACGAWRGNFGLEPTIEHHLRNLVAVFREIRRVMRDDAILFLNYGDAYAGSPARIGYGDQQKEGAYWKDGKGVDPTNGKRLPVKAGLPAKQRFLMPARVALALQEPYEHVRIKRAVDRAWFAGLIDGDGCLTVNAVKPTKGAVNESHAVLIQVRMSDQQALDKIVAITGVSNVTREMNLPSVAANGWRAPSQWRTCGDKAADLIAEVYPHLTIKRNQAVLCWNLQRLRDGVHPTCGKPIPAANMEKRRLLHSLVRKANAREPFDIPGWCKEPAVRTEPGWFVRSEICWAKGVSFCPTYSGSCMPSSVRDRPTDSHEMLYLLSKRANYFYDLEAVREEGTIPAGQKLAKGSEERAAQAGVNARPPEYATSTGTRNIRTVWTIPDDEWSEFGQFRAWKAAQQGELTDTWTINPRGYKEAHFACVDEETECLTTRGWVRHNDIGAGDTAAQHDIGSGLLSWGVVLEVARYHVTDQEMVTASSRDVRLCLTPNHRCVVQARNQAGGLHKPKIVRADALKPGHRIPVAAHWGSTAGATPVSPEWAELLGWWLAEGWVAERRAFLCQSISANPAKTERIREVLAACAEQIQPGLFSAPGGFTETKSDREWRGRPSVMATWRLSGLMTNRLLELGPGKQLQASCVSWRTDLIESLVRGLVDADGHRRPDGRWCFVQKDKGTCDLVQAMAIRLGLPAVLSKREGGWAVFGSHRMTRSLRGTNGTASPLRRSRYTGTVWCPRLPLGTFVARKEGRVFITGNTYPEALVEPCIKAGTSERGACSECGAPWRRVVEASGGTIGESWTDKTRIEAGAWKDNDGAGDYSRTTTGWEPTCAHTDAPTVPCVVLDPFSGSGTTGAVAVRLGRSYVGVELNPEYVALSRKRIGRAAADVGQGGTVTASEDERAAQLGLFGGGG